MLKTATAADPSRRPATADDHSREGMPGEATISTIEMSRLTGVGRERLRTWERRHGFPEPIRAENGIRRYRAADVRPILTVARLVERGIPLVAAIEQAKASQSHAADIDTTFGPALEHASAPMMAVTGPVPLTVLWVNAETAKVPEAPAPGDVLTDSVSQFGPVALSQLQRLMAAPDGTSIVIDHADWLSSFPAPTRSVAWRVSSQATSEPMVVMAQLPEDSGRAFPRTNADGAVWSTAVAAATQTLMHGSGLAAIQKALGEFAKQVGAMDAFLAIDHGGVLRAATSVRGTSAARDLAVRFADPGMEALQAGEIDWLPDDLRRALGAMSRSAVLGVPLLAGGVLVGSAFLMFPQELALGDVARQQLSGLGLTLTLALQREKLAQQAARRSVMTAA